MNRKQQAWLVMGAAYLAGIAVALNQSKVPPAMEVLVAQLKIDLATGGWLMSSFAVAGVVLGIPAAFVLRRLGPKGAGLVALGCTVAGAVLGALATGAAQLLLGRVVEGIGLGLIIVVSPTIISMWFPPQERGLPMGIWATWVPVGGFVAYNSASPIMATFGWQGVWWFGALVALVALVVYAAVVTSPGDSEKPPAGGSAWSGRQLADMLRRPSSWILAVVFGAFNFASMAYNTWTPTYFSQGLGMQPQVARFVASLMSLSVIPALIVAGWILDRTRRRHFVYTGALFAAAVWMMWSFRLTDPNTAWMYMVVLGIVVAFIPASTFTLAPELAPSPELTGIALGLVSIGQNLGTLIGPPVIGTLIAGGNWEAGVAPLVLAMSAGALVSLSLWTRQRAPVAAPVGPAR